MGYILTIDQGTTATKVAIFSADGELKALSKQHIKQFFPHNGWVEQDPYDILNSITRGINEVISNADVNKKDIVAIAIDNQGETIIPFNKDTGEPLYNAIVWQDRRTASFCNNLKKRMDEAVVTEKTGLFLDPYFSASKIKWILDNIDSVRRETKKGRAILATSDVWLLYMLTGGKSIYTDVSTASRTLLFNINTKKWDEEIAGLFGIPIETLPEVVPSTHDFGYCKLTLCEKINVPIVVSVVDQAASLFGHTCFHKGEAKVTYGTGGFLLINTGKERVFPKNKIITVIAAQYSDDIYYVLEGGAYCVGSCIDWLVQNLEFISSPRDTDKIASSLKDNGGVYFIPALVGLSVPYWEPDVKGAFLGLSRDVSKKHLVRAVLEGIAYRFYEIVELIKNDGFNINSISVDGGVSENNFLMQFQADLLGIEIKSPTIKEITSLGCFYLAGLKIGVWHNIMELKKFRNIGKVFLPNSNNKKELDQYRIWKKALELTLKWR